MASIFNASGQLVGDTVEATHKTIKVKMQAGAISETNGEVIGSLTSDIGIFNSFISKQMLKMPYAVSNFSAPVASGETLKVFCYNKSRIFISCITDIANLPSATEYVKFQVSQSEAFTKSEYVLAVTFTNAVEAEFSKNSNPINTTYPYTHFFSYEVSNQKRDTKSSTTNYIGNNGTRVYNNGYIILPKNYSPDGEPVPLVMFTHGSGGYVFGETSIMYYSEYLNFLANNGFAVCDCSGFSSLYKSVTDDDWDYVTPLSIACRTAMYEYIIANYNVRTDGAFVFGKSAGGFMSIALAALQPFKVKASAGLAPAIDMIDILYYMWSSFPTTVKVWIDTVGLDFPNFTSAKWNEFKTYLLANLDRIAGYNPFWENSDGFDFSAWATEIFTNGRTTARPALENIANSASVHLNVPYKFWHAVDDTNVPYAQSKMYQKMVENGGGICEMHTFPAGYGAHHAVDNAANAPKVDYTTKFGETINIPVAYAELVDWFNRWK